MQTRDFDFELPDAAIALRPSVPRDAARLLVVRGNGAVEHAFVRDLPNFLGKGDSFVLNDTKVISARLRGHRVARPGALAGTSAPKIEILLHKRIAADRYLAFARPARKLCVGDRLILGATLPAEVAARGERGEVELSFDQSGMALDEQIDLQGELPLPPYIAGKRQVDARDASDYQTVFAKNAGSVAAPTAGLHFTPQLLATLENCGVARETVTLHVGAGTFLPVSTEDTAGHKMHGEFASLAFDVAARLNGARAAGGRIAAVGTTALRTLESAAAADGTLMPFARETDLFITPGYRFRATDILLTNFHLPCSTLFMLVCAFCGLEKMQAVYAEAISEGYKFYSYGDACLLFPQSGTPG